MLGCGEIVLQGIKKTYYCSKKAQSEKSSIRKQRDTPSEAAVVAEITTEKEREVEKKVCTTGTDQRLQDAGQQHHQITITRSANQMRFRMNSRESQEMVDS